MTVHIVTPKKLKEAIDVFAEVHGVKAFVFSDHLHGNAYAPSKKIRGYRIPMALPEDVFKDVNLSRVLNASHLLVAVSDLNDLGEEALKHLQKAESELGENYG